MLAVLICFYAGLRGWRWITVPMSTVAFLPLTLVMQMHNIDAESVVIGLAITLAMAAVGFALGRGVARLFRLSSATGPSVDRASGQR